jgi:hypothetical protein
MSGGSWWVKPITNPQGPRVPVIEYVVGRLGRLIASPVCEVAIVEISPDIATAAVPAGLAHGSKDVAGSLNLGRPLAHRHDDDNRGRHAGVYALFDWCWGNDEQWLYDPNDSYKLHSHDHGFYLPPAAGHWDCCEMRTCINDPHQLSDPAQDLDPAAVDQTADLLEAVTRGSIMDILLSVPAAWGVPDADLETLGWFLEVRAAAVAGRMRALIGGTS